VLTAKANGKEVQCLVDTGASISVVSSDTFKRMWQHWEVCQLPMPRRLRVAGITGHHISVENYVRMDIEVLGVKMRRPMLVESSLDHTEVVLGWDTIKEEGMMFNWATRKVEIAKRETDQVWSVSALLASQSVSLQPFSIHKVYLTAAINSRVVAPGKRGVCMALDNAEVGLWENLSITSNRSEVVQALVNATDSVIELRQGDCVGRMYNPDFYEEEISKLNDEKINAIFGTIGVEPAVPKKGRIKLISESAKTELLKNAVIDCPRQ
jgi:hypothetical protein